MLDWIIGTLLKIRIGKLSLQDGDVLVLRTSPSMSHKSVSKMGWMLQDHLKKANNRHVAVVVLESNCALTRLPHKTAVRLMRKLNAHLTAKVLSASKPTDATGECAE